MTKDIEDLAGVVDVTVRRTGDTFAVTVLMENLEFGPFESVVKKEVELFERYPQYTFNFDIDSVDVESSILTNAA